MVRRWWQDAWTVRRAVLGVVLFAVTLVLAVTPLAQPGPVHTYTVLWDHDGVQTDSYSILVDGVVATTMLNTPAICPAATPRVCSSPLDMTTNVAHVVLIRAENAFGYGQSDPFSAAPPTVRPVNVKIRK
jgi:hypothetical protein